MQAVPAAELLSVSSENCRSHRNRDTEQATFSNQYCDLLGISFKYGTRAPHKR